MTIKDEVQKHKCVSDAGEILSTICIYPNCPINVKFISLQKVGEKIDNFSMTWSKKRQLKNEMGID